MATLAAVVVDVTKKIKGIQAISCSLPKTLRQQEKPLQNRVYLRPLNIRRKCNISVPQVPVILDWRKKMYVLGLCVNCRPTDRGSNPGPRTVYYFLMQDNKHNKRHTSGTLKNISR